MLDYTPTRQEKRLATLMKWWAILFFAAGICFAFFSNQIINLLSTLGHTIFGWKSSPLSGSNEYFWLVLVLSLMGILTYLSLRAQANIYRNIDYVLIILIAKFISTFGYVFALLFAQHAFAYLAGAVTDGLIFLITLVAYVSATNSRR